MEVDIEHFFVTASHERLMAAVAEVVADGRILRLVQAFLQAGVMEEGKRRTLVAGTPQGACLSPLLSNAFLNTFDHQMLARGRRAVHYCDDRAARTPSETKARGGGAAQEMGVGPPEPPCRGRFQTTASCTG